MKSLLVLIGSVLSLSAHAFSPSPNQMSLKKVILEYTYGNIVESSHLVVYDDGTIDHGERNGETRTDTPEEKLGKEDLESLKQYIAEALDTEPVTRTCLSTANGVLGSFIVKFDVKSVPIRTNTSFGTNHCMSKSNPSPAAKQLEFFVNLFVKIKLPEIH